MTLGTKREKDVIGKVFFTEKTDSFSHDFLLLKNIIIWFSALLATCDWKN
jgi:microcompartment protein CcmK/EutM